MIKHHEPRPQRSLELIDSPLTLYLLPVFGSGSEYCHEVFPTLKNRSWVLSEADQH